MTGNAIQLANQQFPLLGHLITHMSEAGLKGRGASADDGQGTDQNKTDA